MSIKPWPVWDLLLAALGDTFPVEVHRPSPSLGR
jgi:hypothetical protein